MLEKMKGWNRALLELFLGILFWGCVLQVAGCLFAEDILVYSVSMWLGIAAALASAFHMYKSLDKALSMGAGAYGASTKAAMIRYLAWALFLGIIMCSGILNPIYAFFGLITLKVAAYMQPFTHRFCNFIFQEEDPVPEAIPCEEDAD